MIFIFCLLIGLIAGLLAGLLGIGGGIIVVPLLHSLFQYQAFPAAILMHTAIGTSFAIMIFTALSSAYAYYQRKLIDWQLFFHFAPGLMLGTIMGAYIGKHFSSEQLKIAFALFLLLIALHMFFPKQIKQRKPLPNLMYLTFAAVVIGIFSGFFGIGGGTLMVPFFTYCSVEMHRATGTSALCGFPLAIIGTISFMLTGWHTAALHHAPMGTVGYVYWPAALVIAMISMFVAPLGTRLSVNISAVKLKKIFAIVLFATAINLLLN